MFVYTGSFKACLDGKTRFLSFSVGNFCFKMLFYLALLCLECMILFVQTRAVLRANSDRAVGRRELVDVVEVVA